jgi:hypothetical protein
LAWRNGGLLTNTQLLENHSNVNALG